MDTITLKYGAQQFDLPRDSITIDDVQSLFDVNERGLHIKIQIGNEWKNEFPSLHRRFENVGSARMCYVVSFFQPYDLIGLISY